MAVTGPDFIALQLPDLERAASFYETHLGLHRAPQSPPGAVVFPPRRSPLPSASHYPTSMCQPKAHNPALVSLSGSPATTRKAYTTV